MNTILKFALTVTTGISFLTACTNGSTTSNEDTTANASASANMVTQDTTKTDNDTMKMDNGLMQAMESMMTKMNSMQMSGDFDQDFANMLIEHHQGAIDMGQVEVSKGNDAKMKSMAQELITKQKDEQDKLRDIVKSSKPSGMRHGEGELQKSMSDMGSQMKGMQMSGDVDKDFASMMASHHKDGITMSKKEVLYGMNSQLKQMAQKGIKDQTKDIEELNTWLASHK